MGRIIQMMIPQRATECFTELSNDVPVIALPEEDTLLMNQNTIQIVGSKPYHLFKDGSVHQLEPNQIYFTQEFRKFILSSE